MAPKFTAQQRLQLIERVLKGESISKVTNEAGISRVLFYRWLRKYKEKGSQGLFPQDPGRPRRKQAPQLKEEYKRLSPQDRLEIIRGIKEGESIAGISKRLGTSRTTAYKWVQRYKRASGDTKELALEDKKPQVEFYFRQTPEKYEQAVLSLVAKHPEFGIRRLVANLPKVGVTPIVGHHGVQNILRRHALSHYPARLSYAQSQITPTVAATMDILGQVSRFFSIPYVIRSRVVRFVSVMLLSAITTIVIFGFGAILTSSILGASGVEKVGTIFALLALLMGSVFFLYSLKYYLTLAIVLSFSQGEGGENILSSTKNGNGKRKGILSWLLGIGKGNGLRPGGPQGREGNGRVGPMGLEPNLDHVVLKRHPFISVHIPLYNEKNVVERLINASTGFDYKGNYEVILCDDSTDETTQIIRNYLQTQNSKLKTQKGEGWELTQAEVRPGVILKHLHRTSRKGFKGGALRLALSVCDPRAEFISVFDADFVPYPDTLTLFLKYFQVSAGSLSFQNPKSKVQNPKQYQNSNDASSNEFRDLDLEFGISRSNIAAVQGYQWHVLNKSENWITRGVRSEYAGSYVIERSGTEIYGGLKQISGSVYMVRRDVLNEVGWETSITEDFELTLKLYEKGYKVVYTPYIQAPAECVSTIKRLIRQRMRWAEGHSHNVKKMFVRLMFGKWQEKTVDDGRSMVENPSSKVFVPSPLSPSEKLEFLYLSPYYLQAFFFLVGTLSWLISETIFRTHLPFWTELWGWSLVLTNLFALPLMNAVGLFLEESEEKDYSGLASFVALSYILVPFQAYAALKGLIQREEGPWFRTPKTGRITDIFTRGKFFRFIQGILPGRNPVATQPIQQSTSSFLPALALSKIAGFSARKRTRWFSRATLSIFILVAILLNYLSFFTPKAAYAQAADPGIEQQINIIDQEYTCQVGSGASPSCDGSANAKPSDNSLGIIQIDPAKYRCQGANCGTLYFSAMGKATTASGNEFGISSGLSMPSVTKEYTVRIYADSTTTGCTGGQQKTRAAIGLYNKTDGSFVTNGTLFTSYGTCYDPASASRSVSVRAGWVSIVQSDATNITDTVNSIELGDNQSVVGQSYAGLTNPKYFYLDTSKYDGTVSAHFEASMLGGQGASGTQSVFMSGFETGDFIEWTTTGSSPQANTSTARSGSYSAELEWQDLIYKVIPDTANVGFRFGIRLTDATPALNSRVVFIDDGGGTSNWDIWVLSDGKVRIQNLGNSTNYDSSNAVFSDNTWHLIEFKGNINNSTGSIGLKVDGSEVISQSNIDTDNGIVTARQIQFENANINPTQTTAYIDDVYFINSNTYPGDGKIVALQPNASGDEGPNNWQQNKQNELRFCILGNATIGTVNETPKQNWTDCGDGAGNPSIDTYMRNTASAGGTILFGLENALAGGIVDNDTINDVWYRMWARRGNGSGTVHAIRKKWAGSASSTSCGDLGTSGSLCSLQETGTLSVTNVDSAQLGADKQSGGRKMDVETEWMMVDYTPQTTMKARLEQCDEASCSWTEVTDSAKTTTSTSWSLLQSGDIWSNLTTGRIYRVAVSISGSVNSQKIANAKLIVEQTAAGGITALETVQEYVNTLATTTSTTYVDNDTENQYDPANFAGGTFSYFFEATLKTSAGTGYAKLRNNTNVDEIDAPTTSEVSTTSTSYVRQRSANLASNTDWPTAAKNMDTIRKVTSPDTVSISTSWLIIQVSNLQIPENLLLFVPFILFMPAIIRWFKKRRLGFRVQGIGYSLATRVDKRSKRRLYSNGYPL